MLDPPEVDVELGKVSRVFEDKQGEEWVFSDKGVSIFVQG